MACVGQRRTLTQVAAGRLRCVDVVCDDGPKIEPLGAPAASQWRRAPVDDEMLLARSTRAVARAARTQRWVSVAALESKVTTDEAKQELNRLKMALGASRLETGGKR